VYTILPKGKPETRDEINTEDAKRIVDQADEFGASFFRITGGEALLRKYTPEQENRSK
jgi:MoaA/NifB/PqqE/SkfB family radical SAM enzyme